MAIPVAAWLGAIILKAVGAALLAFAIKVLVVLGAYVLYRVFLWKGEVVIDWLLSQIGSVDLSTSTLDLVGLAAWLGNCLQIQECITLAVSFGITALVARFALSFK